MVFHWSLCDSKSSYVFRTLRSILANLSNDGGWTVAILPLISNSSSSFSKPLVTAPSAPTTITVTLPELFNRFLSSLTNSLYTFIFFSFLNFYFAFCWNGFVLKMLNSLISIIFFIIAHIYIISHFYYIFINTTKSGFLVLMLLALLLAARSKLPSLFLM